VLLFLGVALGCLRVVQDTTGIPVSLPRFWHTSGVLWYAIAGGLVAAGIAMQRQLPVLSSGWRPSERGIRFRTVILYTRPGCGLCDEAAEILRGYRRWMPAFEERNIDSDPLLTEHFGQCIPVVEIDGRVRFRGKINEILLRRMIEATPPLDARSAGAA
jgi:hypothetical protein